jgi:hypothetical protein
LSAFVRGTDAARERLDVRWMGWTVGAAAVVVVASAVVLRVSSPADAADVAFAGAVVGVCVPLLAFAMVARACRYGRLDDAVFAAGRDGASRRGAALGIAALVTARVMFVAASLGALVAVVANPTYREGFFDAMHAAVIGGLTGAAYAALFALGSLFGRFGSGRVWVFVMDVILGHGSLGIAVFWPRAHVRSLLGGAHVLGIAAWQSGTALVLLAIAYFAASIARVPR